MQNNQELMPSDEFKTRVRAEIVILREESSNINDFVEEAEYLRDYHTFVYGSTMYPDFELERKEASNIVYNFIESIIIEEKSRYINQCDTHQLPL